jgi:osmotically-inducible protein OsmY
MVILRGTVADEEEARRIANLVSLTPGVYEVRNELTYPKLPVLDR